MPLACRFAGMGLTRLFTFIDNTVQYFLKKSKAAPVFN